MVYAFETAAKKYQLESNGPIIARRMIDSVISGRKVGAFAVVACAYDETNRVYAHRTLQAAFRRLASICAGKLNRRGEFAAAIVTPDMRVMNYHEAKLAYAHGIAAEVAASPVQEPETRVIFRKDSHEVTAVFPDETDRGLYTCYAHVGQHGSCSYEWYRTTKPATESEYAALKRELESAPYNYRFRVMRRMAR